MITIRIAKQKDFYKVKQCIKDRKHDIKIIPNEFSCFTCGYRINLVIGNIYTLQSFNGEDKQ